MSTKSLQACLSRFAAFATLPKSHLAALVDAADLQEHPEGAVLHNPGAPAEEVYFVHAGRVALRRRSSPHRVFTVDTFDAGELFGEGCLWTPLMREDTAIAVAPVLLSAVPRVCLRLFLDDHPLVERALVERAIARRDAALRRVFDAMSLSVRARLAAALLDLCKPGGSGSHRRELAAKWRHRELAAHIGATRETVTAELLRFEREGFIAREDRVIVLRDPEGLDACAREEVPPITAGRTPPSAGLYTRGATMFYVATDGAVYRLRAPGRRTGLSPVDALPAGCRPAELNDPELRGLIAFTESGSGKPKPSEAP